MVHRSAPSVPGAPHEVARGPSVPSANIYAAAGANRLAPVVAGMPDRIYVPQSAGRGIYVIDPATFKLIDR